MSHIKLGDTRLEDIPDAEFEGWCRKHLESYRDRVHEKTVRLWTEIMRAYDRVGTPVTVRQMFYALVSVGAVEKTELAYGKVATQSLAMRRSGAVPYGWIADATRWMRKPASYDSLSDFLTESTGLYRRNLCAGMGVRVEIWCEKDALAGVFAPITEEWDVPLMVTRGFSSETFAHSAAEVVNKLGAETHV